MDVSRHVASPGARPGLRGCSSGPLAQRPRWRRLSVREADGPNSNLLKLLSGGSRALLPVTHSQIDAQSPLLYWYKKKKMIILHKGTAKHRTDRTSSPQGEPDGPPSVLTPQSPCTIERAVGVGTLYRDTIYASAAKTNVTTPFCTGRGGSSIPSCRRRILLQGHPRPPPSHARAAILLQCQIKGNH